MDRVCPFCRLLQEPAETCRSCGQTDLVPRSEAFERLAEVTKPGRQLGWSRVTQSLSIERLKFALLGAGVLVGAALLAVYALDQARAVLFWGGVAAIIAGVFGAVACEVFVSEDPGSKELAAVPYAPGRPAGARVLKGLAQKLEHSVKSHTTGERCLAAHLTLRDEEGRIYFRGLRASDFVIAADGADPAVVAGEVWIEPDDGGFTKTSVAKTRLGVHGDYPEEPVAGEHLVRQGDEVEAVGIATSEVIGQLADGYRDGGMTTVLRGTPGRPVVVKVVRRG
jgi:hypothetical protein